MRQVQDPYNGFKVGTRNLQGVGGGYGTPTRSMRQVHDPYKGYEVGKRYSQGV